MMVALVLVFSVWGLAALLAMVRVDSPEIRLGKAYQTIS